MFQNSFQDNNLIGTKSAVSLTLDTLLVLYAETFDPDIKKLIERVIDLHLLDEDHPYYKELVDMYLTCSKKLVDSAIT